MVILIKHCLSQKEDKMSDGTATIDTKPPVPVTQEGQGEAPQPAEQPKEPGLIDKARAKAVNTAKAIKGLFTREPSHDVVKDIADGKVNDVSVPTETAQPLSETTPDEVVAAAETTTKAATPPTENPSAGFSFADMIDRQKNISNEDVASEAASGNVLAKDKLRKTKDEPAATPDTSDISTTKPPETKPDTKDPEPDTAEPTSTDASEGKVDTEPQKNDKSDQTSNNKMKPPERTPSTPTPEEPKAESTTDKAAESPDAKSDAETDNTKPEETDTEPKAPDSDQNDTPKDAEEPKAEETDTKQDAPDSSDETTNPQDNKPDAKPADPEPANDSAESTKDTQPDAKPSENAEPKSELDKQRDALLERLKEQGMPEEKIKQLEQVMKENPDAIQHISDKVDELQGMTPEEAAQAQEEMQNELAQLQKESDEAKARGEALPPEKAKRLGILKGLLLTVGIILAAGFVGTALVATTAASMGGGRR